MNFLRSWISEVQQIQQKDAPGVLQKSLLGSRKLQFIKWNWVDCSVHILIGPWPNLPTNCCEVDKWFKKWARKATSFWNILSHKWHLKGRNCGVLGMVWWDVIWWTFNAFWVVNPFLQIGHLWSLSWKLKLVVKSRK